MPPIRKIECQCPQCGAPVLLEETDHLFACAHCRVRLYILGAEPLRYFLSARTGLGREILYAPYWWFRGAVFRCHPSGIRHRVVDLSLPAVRHRSFPVSVGLRTQTLRLRYVAPETKGVFLKIRIPREEGILRMGKQIEGLAPLLPDQAPSFSVSVGEGPSLLYSPFFEEKGVLYDGVLGKNLGPLDPPLDPGEEGEGLPADESGAGKLSFLPLLCPDCGNDLSGEKGSVILFCMGCGTAMSPFPGGFRKIPSGYIPASEEGVFYLPFWRMKISDAALRLTSFADLAKMANLPAMIRPSWTEQPCHIWSPAFRIPPALFLRLTRQMTLGRGAGEEVVPSHPRSPVHPVTLRSGQAAEGLRVHLFNMAAVDRAELLSKLAGISLKPQEEVLIHVPFLQKGGDLIHERLRFSLPRAALSMQG